MNANRWLVAVGISGGVFLALVIIGSLHPTGTLALFSQGDSIETLFQGLLTSIITGVTLVLALSQLVLSQELGTVGDQRERMEGAMSFRKDVEDVIEEPVSPAQPSAFPRSLVKLTKRRAKAVSDAIQDNDDEALIDLSRTMLYASVPALITAVAGIVYLEPALFPGTVFSVRPLVVVVSAGVALLPFAFLLSYILRIVTITKRTLSIGPFILRGTDQSCDLDRGETEAKSGENAGVNDKSE